MLLKFLTVVVIGVIVNLMRMLIIVSTMLLYSFYRQHWRVSVIAKDVSCVVNLISSTDNSLDFAGFLKCFSFTHFVL